MTRRFDAFAIPFPIYHDDINNTSGFNINSSPAGNPASAGPGEPTIDAKHLRLAELNDRISKVGPHIRIHNFVSNRFQHRASPLDSRVKPASRGRL